MARTALGGLAWPRSGGIAWWIERADGASYFGGVSSL